MIKKPPHLIILDLDGTLLDDNKEISLDTIKYLKHLESEGHYIVIATGRPLVWVTEYYNELDLKTPIICYNGSLIYEREDSPYPSREIAFDIDFVIKYWNKIKENSVNIILQIGNELFQDNVDDFNDIFPWTKRFMDSYIVHTGPLEKVLNKKPLTILIHTKGNEKYKDYFLNSIKGEKDLGIRFWFDSPFFELYKDNVSKMSSAEELRVRYGIDKENVIAFGDAENDEEMLRFANHSYAMKNAHELVKTYAKNVTEFDNNHEGVLHALKDYFEEK